MRLLEIFLRQLNSRLEFNEENVLRLNNLYFHLTDELKDHIIDRGSLIYAGEYLGKDLRRFVPGSLLLEKLGKEKCTNRVYVNQDTGWLFFMREGYL